MEKIRVFGLFRIPISYFNSLLEKFSKEENIELKVAFSIKPQNEDILPDKSLNYVFLNGAEEAYFNNEHSELDHKLKQRSVIDEIESFQPDVLFLNTGYLMPTTWLAINTARKLGIPMVTRMTTEGVKPRNIVKRVGKRLIVGSYCKKMNAGVYECLLQKNYLVEYGMDPDMLFFSPCAVDNNYFSELSKRYTKSEAKSMLGLEQDCTVIVSTAELIERKRPVDLIRAVRNLRSSYKIKTFFIGKGVLMDNLQNYIRDNSLTECVLCGRLNHVEMSLYLCAADIFVMSSEYDASPKALNEAMNFGVAIVVTDGVCTAPELCKEGVNGYVYHARDIDGLTQKIETLILDRNKIDEMGENSKEIVSEFSYDNVIKGWKEAIYSCLNNHK